MPVPRFVATISLPVPRFIATIRALFRFVACTVQLTPWKRFERASQCNSLSGFHMFSEMEYLRNFGQQCDLFPERGTGIGLRTSQGSRSGK